MNSLSYPIGKYEPQLYSEELKETWLADIRFLPQALEAAIINLDEAQLQTPYRDGGWTVNQLVHHVADSHMNAFCRMKLGFTETEPTIKPYDQDAWAQTADVARVPINVSITLLHSLHWRWFALLQSFSRQDFERTIIHPEYQQTSTLWYLLGNYAWHGRHHVAHITALRERNNW